jgi:hypothetical protein
MKNLMKLTVLSLLLLASSTVFAQTELLSQFYINDVDDTGVPYSKPDCIFYSDNGNVNLCFRSATDVNDQLFGRISSFVSEDTPETSKQYAYTTWSFYWRCNSKKNDPYPLMLKVLVYVTHKPERDIISITMIDNDTGRTVVKYKGYRI